MHFTTLKPRSKTDILKKVENGLKIKNYSENPKPLKAPVSNLTPLMKPGVQAIIFDFDYTLADSSPGVIECINFALGNLGMPSAADATIRRTIGLSLPDTFMMLVGKKYIKYLEAFTRLFVERADEVMVDNSVLLTNVPETVEALQRLDIQLGILSLKGRYRIQAILERERLLEPFKVIIGGEDVPEHKPSPKGLLTAIVEMNCHPQNALYVGDSVTDAETARRAGIAFVAVLSGVTPRTAFESYNAYAILEDVSGLLSLEPIKNNMEVSRVCK